MTAARTSPRAMREPPLRCSKLVRSWSIASQTPASGLPEPLLAPKPNPPEGNDPFMMTSW
ncbi:hypothetical protein [Microbacterium suwonense]|uniref:Uncharacterized protein n=1 Tax=Microbacterium suwonense TaxID=683047 RepID=A0ABN6X4T9_9MICO|nr:hypothetical protein [Microbacterium suwonense]BDZ39770.1 hypothetical protein GCM10025863_23840 [Microbacterium suwonense]